MEPNTFTAFAGTRLIVSGNLSNMLKGVKARLETHGDDRVLIFEDETGKQVDFDFRGTIEDVLARVAPEKNKPGPGRPSLGVVCGEVSLLPRHWEWLERQQHNVSATIRRLVDDAIRTEPPEAKARYAIEAADRVMWVLAGDLPGCEEASRALYAREFDRFGSFAKAWPADVAAHLRALAAKGEVAVDDQDTMQVKALRVES
ncbi:MAG: DUF2239 family protein [Spirochaetes bacterium]|nr:DUF2239 family protein [Spirochaetota bacterium]